MFTKIINGLKFDGLTMLVQCQHTLLADAADNADLSETGMYVREDLSPGHPLGDVRSAIFRVVRTMPMARISFIPFYPAAADNLGPLIGSFVKRLIAQPAWRTHLESGPTVIQNPNSIYLPTWDDWELSLSLRCITEIQMETDDVLAILTATGARGIGLTCTSSDTGTFSVDSSGIEVIEG